MFLIWVCVFSQFLMRRREVSMFIMILYLRHFLSLLNGWTMILKIPTSQVHVSWRHAKEIVFSKVQYSKILKKFLKQLDPQFLIFNSCYSILQPGFLILGPQCSIILSIEDWFLSQDCQLFLNGTVCSLILLRSFNFFDFTRHASLLAFLKKKNVENALSFRKEALSKF